MKNKTKLIHIAIILIGIVFISISAFHTSIWFDESYSVAISNNHSFAEIWSIGGHDVHPVFYYWMLKIVSLLFGNQILLYRLLSVVAIAILGILGYTHIRKDFGEKVGLYFSFLVFFLPINVVYASEIRMYAWGMLFATIMAIYAYRIFKGNSSIKNWIIFAIFSLLSAYTHYYGLMTAGIINIILFAYFTRKAIKQKQWTTDLTKFVVQGVIQILLYLPWVLSLLLQVSQVSKGFWIGLKFPDTLVEMFLFQFTGNLGATIHVSDGLAAMYGVFVCIVIAYLLGKHKQSKENLEPAKLALGVYILVILGAALVSLVIWRPVIYARYFLIITGLLIFCFSYFFAKLRRYQN